MAQLEKWSAPKSDAVLATYRVAAGKLKPCKGQDSRPHTKRARGTLALWNAAQAFPETSMMIVQSDDAMSLGILNGGIIVEGRDKLNVGMFRATTRNLKPVYPEQDSAVFDTSDRFRRTFQMIVERLDGAVLPRAFEFRLGVVCGTIYADNGTLQFTGDFDSPSAFVLELKAACEVDDEIKYTFSADFDVPDSPEYAVTDLIAEVATPSDTSSFTFDDSGWPIEWDRQAPAATVHKLSLLANAAGQVGHVKRPLLVSLLSDKNDAVVSMTIDEENRIVAHLC